MTQFRRIKKCLGVLFIVFIAASLFSARVSAQGDEASGIVLQASAGFDSFYKAENGLPVRITVANSGRAVEGELQLTVSSASASDSVVYSAPISLPTQSNKRVTLYPHLAGFVSELRIDLVDEQGRVIESTISERLSQLSADDLLYVVISPDPGELSFLENLTGRRANAAVAFLDADELPEVAAAWNAIDILVLNDVDTGRLSTAQIGALEGWASTGGQLVVTGGPGWQKTTAGLGHMLPVSVSGSTSVDGLPALEADTGVPFRDPGPYLVATSSLVNGELLYHQDGLPVLARREWGSGVVYFLSLDPKLAPLLDWDGSEKIWAKIAGSVPSLPAWGKGVQNSYAASTAVTSLPSLALPSLFQLILFLIVYVLVVGPGNYLLLKRINRRELAWVSIPGLVIIFSGLAYTTGFQLKGNEIILNQMSIAYGQIGADQIRVQTLVGLYSPRRATYDLVFPFNTLARPFDRDFGRLGGSGNISTINRSDALIISDIRVDVSDTETFVSDSYLAGPQLSGQASLGLNGSDIELEIDVRNDSDILLENVTLVLGSEVIALRDLAPGQSASRTHSVGAVASTTGVPGVPPPSAPAFISGPGSGSPLTNHAHEILGMSDYYNDREAFPRWQLLQAIEGDGFATSSGSGTRLSTDVVTLLAWSNAPLLDLGLENEQVTTISTVFYLLEIPLIQRILTGSNVSLPVSLLNWRVLADSGIYQASIQNLYLNGGWVEFEYEPWAELQRMRVEELELVLTKQDSSIQPAPEVRLWDWKDSVWVTLESADWGTTSVQRPALYVGPGNAVRIRLQDRNSFSTGIGAVYPILTGDIQ